ncbi:hypothetical protein [Pseudobutyrivibrio sp. LB2011]|uniref:hypothetical protein n=1 Tax=Pseudobutyrivibrio sp. LB2011 TaxID=1408312 RepID=UPI0005D24541|nr:hypothetical protein [Pseudobutyrivibrio sp. LB2011]
MPNDILKKHINKNIIFAVTYLAFSFLMFLICAYNSYADIKLIFSFFSIILMALGIKRLGLALMLYLRTRAGQKKVEVFILSAALIMYFLAEIFLTFNILPSFLNNNMVIVLILTVTSILNSTAIIYSVEDCRSIYEAQCILNDKKDLDYRKLYLTNLDDPIACNKALNRLATAMLFISYFTMMCIICFNGEYSDLKNNIINAIINTEAVISISFFIASTYLKEQLKKDIKNVNNTLNIEDLNNAD